ncbi:12130_t:CDS:1, partial [Gigaspora margarita]
LAKTMFAIVLSQASCKQNFSILKWFSERYRIQLQVLQMESMVQVYLFYISNVKKELRFCNNNVEIELHSSVFNEIIFAEINSSDLSKDDDDEADNKMDNEVEFVNLMANKIMIALQN